jgi:uncharacterized protein (TIGR02145 family)
MIVTAKIDRTQKLFTPKIVKDQSLFATKINKEQTLFEPKVSKTQKVITTSVEVPNVLVITQVKYGYQYNVYVAINHKNIAPPGWHVATVADYEELRLIADPVGSYNSNVATNKLRETGITYWTTTSLLITNELGFNARGAGSRQSNGVFSGLKGVLYFWEQGGQVASMVYFFTTFFTGERYTTPTQGFSIRCVKDNSTNTGTMTGNDGKVYPTVKIGNQVWMACNSAETKYRDGTAITKVTDATAWAALTTEGYCAYDNDESNVLI